MLRLPRKSNRNTNRTRTTQTGCPSFFYTRTFLDLHLSTSACAWPQHRCSSTNASFLKKSYSITIDTSYQKDQPCNFGLQIVASCKEKRVKSPQGCNMSFKMQHHWFVSPTTDLATSHTKLQERRISGSFKSVR